MMSVVTDPLNWTNDVALPFEWATDQRLSFGARGVLAELVATPPDGEMSVDHLMSTMPDSEPADVVEGFLVELERVGYLRRVGECWYLHDPFPL